MVQEEKQSSYQRWNLPGGHVDMGEPPPIAAERELREETHLSLPVTGLIGIYQTPHSFRFVFRADLDSQQPVPGDEILAVRFMSPDEVIAMPDEQLVSHVLLRHILRDLKNNILHPLAIFDSNR
jgi:ADP-ribose pyrophosphatase YjhB (NUDIX family)